ncbi:MAG: hypothetical protein ACR2PX_07580 [Endozoicomonas sp.]|uniref:hypothetical protein n=1 Tax=Endozoicomonas sp. TaxID=1892382 RepID=UPI003D9B2DBD
MSKLFILFRPCFSLLTLLMMTFMTSTVTAGTGWFVTIQNHSGSDLKISFAGNDDWYCNDFCGPSTLKPNETRTFCTEEKERSDDTGH